ncbi:MAG: type II toxin-antitoxin system RelE/ParE family toxin [Planctomycetota bacterium]
MTPPYRLHFRQQALDDIDQIVTEIARDTPQNAERFRDRLLESFEQVSAFPYAYRPLFPEDPQARDLRRGLIRNQPNHLFFFRITGQNITILRVLDGRRNNLKDLLQDTK